MKQLKSTKIDIPIVYLIENDKDFKELPMGIPFIRGNNKDYDEYVKLLEFEVLFKSALATGLPFNWESILKKNGYNNLSFTRNKAISFFSIGECYKDEEQGELGEPIITESTCTVSDFVMDIGYIVDIDVIKALKIIPEWFNNIEKAIETNIMNTIIYNPYLYDKKTDLMMGACEFTDPKRNLIIIDISGSIPKAVSESILLLSKTMSFMFYADVLITGSKSTLYDYQNLDLIDVKRVYNENGMDNDQVYFRKIVNEHKQYNTVIVFGDNHSPSMNWSNEYNEKTKHIEIEKGKELCKFEVSQIYSFHTTSKDRLAGYADWFNVPTENIKHISNWVYDLSNN